MNEAMPKEDAMIIITHISECPLKKRIITRMNKETGRKEKICICKGNGGRPLPFNRCILHKYNVIIKTGEVFHNS